MHPSPARATSPAQGIFLPHLTTSSCFAADFLRQKNGVGGKFDIVKQSRLKSGSQDLGLIQVLRFIFHEIQVDLIKWHGCSKIL
ncbi:MAG: hypothetical protein ACKO5E_18015 [bacterium]